ncbi:MAG: low-specificity L-threonine aldolase [Gammaproteobacteria bacterium]|nr:low-specificity L-threonine aldolase [Gammaproteobacteria bacterium]
MNTIDFRSDTVTQPTPAMRAAMADAVVGDDVYGEDPTINELERRVAELTAQEAAVFATSGTQSNLLGIMSHCGRGDEYIVGQDAHTYKLEGGGAAVLGSIQPQPIEMQADGTLDLTKVEAAIKPDDSHFARTRLICLENTTQGRVLTQDYVREAGALAAKHGLGIHLDGARAFNAAVKLGVPLAAITGPFDTVSICLSKGLGAPVGSVLAGKRRYVDRARRWRKVVGGGLRQSGILGAAALIALDQHVDRIADDHANALHLAQGLAAIGPLRIDLSSVQTNMVFVQIPPGHNPGLQRFLGERGIKWKEGQRIRLVTHLDINRDDINTCLATVREYFS